MRRIAIILGVLLVVFACIALPVFIAASGRAQGTQPGVAAALKKATIDTGDITLTVSATGNIVAKRQSAISFDQPGRVQTVLVQEGQKVEAGQLLAQQEDSTQQSNVAQANSAVDAAQAALQKLLRPVDAGDLAKAQANVKAAEAGYSAIASAVSPEQIKAYELQYQKAAQGAIDANKLRADTGGRYAQDDPNYQKALAQYGQASFDAEIARLRLEQVKRGSSLDSATANIAYQQALLAQLKAGPKPIDIESTQLDLVSAKQQRDQAQHALDKTRLVAPFAGTVTTVNIKPGEVSAGAAMVVTDTSELYIDVNVDETDIGEIRVGQPVELTLDALSGIALTGKVQRIAQTATTAASVITYPVRVIFDPTTAPLKVGMTANATFLVREAHDVLRIPNEYLRFDRNTKQNMITLVNPDGTLMDVPVTLGLQGAAYSEVIDGLNEGETVALANTAASSGK